MTMVMSIFLFGAILFFFLFCSRCGKLRTQGYIFALVICLLWPISFLFILILSPHQWKKILDTLGIKTNDF